jgi:superfamily II DNA or RNA helicase
MITKPKTRCGLIAISRFLSKNHDKIIMIVVPSDPVKQQWLDELDKWGLLQENISVHTMYDTSRNKYDCDMLVIDEIHKCGAPTLLNVFNNISYKIILGLTATFERLDGKDEIISKYCPVIDTISIQEAIDNKWLSSYREYEVLIEPEDIDFYQKINKEFYNDFAFFDYDFNQAMKCATDWKARANLARKISNGNSEIFKEVNKNVLIHAMGFNRTLQARKKYIYTHPKKIELTNLILEKRKDKKCMTFSATVAMAEQIGYGQVYSGKDTKKKGRITLQEFIEQNKGTLNTVMKLNEGFNCPDISVAVILGFNSSPTVKKQRLGRIVRMKEGKEAEVFTLVLKGTVEESWYQKSTSAYSYIPIDEQGLRDVLDGKDVIPKIPRKTNFKLRW